MKLDSRDGKPYKDYTLFEFLSETILECCGPVEWPVSQTFTDVEEAVVVFMFFVVKVVVVSGPATTDAKDVKESLGFRLVPVRIVSICFGDGTPREWVLPQEIRSIYQPRGLEADQDGVERNRTGEPAQETLQTADLFRKRLSLLEPSSVYPVIEESLGFRQIP